MKGCETWFDGCNECKIDANGKETQCTKKLCDRNEKAECLKKVGELAPTLDAIDKKLKNCASWFNGCNYCEVIDGKLGKCTRNECNLFRRPFCKIPIETKYKDVVVAKKDCGVWFDGCNTCKIKNEEIDDSTCSDNFCEKPGKEFCQEKVGEIKKRRPIVPGGCKDFFDGCNECKVTNGKIDKASCTTKTCV